VVLFVASPRQSVRAVRRHLLLSQPSTRPARRL